MNRLSLISTLILIGVFVVVAMPFMASAQSPGDTGGLVPCGKDTNGNNLIDPNERCTICHIFVVADRIIGFLLFQVTMPLAVVFILYGGILMVTAAGSEPQIIKGKRFLMWTVIGMVIAFAAWIIVNLIISTLVPSTFNFTFGTNWWSYTCP